jgi:hypothetical protein
MCWHFRAGAGNHSAPYPAPASPGRCMVSFPHPARRLHSPAARSPPSFHSCMPPCARPPTRAAFFVVAASEGKHTAKGRKTGARHGGQARKPQQTRPGRRDSSGGKEQENGRRKRRAARACIKCARANRSSPKVADKDGRIVRGELTARPRSARYQRSARAQQSEAKNEERAKAAGTQPTPFFAF